MQTTEWHHAPLHRFVPGAVHMVTAGTLYKAHLFTGVERLELMQSTLLRHLDTVGWRPHAWACFSNHYHVIVSIPDSGKALSPGIKSLHGQLAISLNKRDGVSGRKVMYQFWDTCITFDNSYYPRLNYVMNNPVKHKLVSDARSYSWCSAAWFHDQNSSAFRRKVASYGCDEIEVPDDF